MRTTGTGGSGRGATSGRGTDRDGAVRLSARLTPDEGARLLAEVDARGAEMERDARAGGWYEGHDAHRADALVDLARTAAPGSEQPAGPEAMVHVSVDYDALVRGHTVGEERCEIPGIGPVPISVARRLDPQGHRHQRGRDPGRGPHRPNHQGPPAHRPPGPRSHLHRPGLRDAPRPPIRPPWPLRRKTPIEAVPAP